MKKNYFEFTFLAIHIVALTLFIYEIIQAGVSNIRLYQVLLLVAILVSFVDRMSTFLKNRKQE
jgi:hypothetical protein